MTGYLGIKLLGETFTWKRSTGPLERCAAGQSADLVRTSVERPVRNHSTATPLATLVALSALAATVVSTQLTNRSVRSATMWRC